jgi:tRNA(Ile)-lysidine synthetase-like protein
MPRLERVNPSFLTGFKRMTENLRSDSDYLDGVARQFISEHAPGGKISVRQLAQAHRAVAARVLCMLYSRISADMLERVHIDALLSLAKSAQNCASVSLPDGIRAFVADGELCFTDEPSESPITFEYPIHEGANRFDKLGFAIFVVKRGDMCSDLQKDNETLQNIYKLSIHTILSSDKIKHMLFVRQRRDGDVYVFGGMTRKLKKLYNDRKWSHKKRRETPILCDGDGIVWVPEFPSADRMKGQGDVEITYYYNGD